MKLLSAAFLIGMGIAQAQTGGLESTTFVLSQSTQAVSLEQKQYETVYRTDQVPSTCYRDEVQGTRTQCHTEYDRSCHSTSREVCNTRSYPVCTSVPRQSCSDHEVCSTTSDSVCNSKGCTSIPRRSCHNQTSCSTTSSSVCHDESRQVCSIQPSESCQNIPRQACSEVPNVVQVPYACTKPVEVPVGQKLKLDTKAVVNISFLNFNEIGPLSESFIAKLADGNVSFVLASPSPHFLYQTVTQTRTESMISETEKLVTYQLVLQATSIAKLNSFLSFQLTNPKLFYDRIEFGFSGALNIPFKGHLKLVQKRFLGNSSIIDDDFNSSAIVTQGVRNVLSFNNFGVTTLKSKLHYITLSLGIDLDAIQKDLINPDAIALIQNQGQPLVAESSDYPTE